MVGRNFEKTLVPSGTLTRRIFPAKITEQLLPSRPLGRNLWLFVWIILVIAAGQISLYLEPSVGLYVTAAVLASLIWLALWQERIRQLAISVAIIPLAMMLSLSLPSFTVFERSAVFSIFILTMGLIYQYLFTLDYPLEGTRLKMTRHGHLFAIPLMIMLGQFLGIVAYGLLRNQYDFGNTPLILVILGAIIFGIAEEILFRGLIQQRAMALFHPIVAAALSAVLYGLLSFGHRGGVMWPLFGLLLGSILAYIYYYKQNILLTIAINVSTKLTFVCLVAVFILQ